MMSGWSLTDLIADLPSVTCPVSIVAGREDSWIPLRLLRRVAARLPRAVMQIVDGGHLLHEDRPDTAAELILEAARNAGP
jgi:magnesium chelatase accessory protein